jgi:hypothetical protein
MIAGGIPAHAMINMTAVFPAKLKQKPIVFIILNYNKRLVDMMRTGLLIHLFLVTETPFRCSNKAGIYLLTEVLM